MGKNINYKELEKFRDKLEKTFDDKTKQDFMEKCCKELAARLLSRVIKRTPVETGFLRRDWTANNEIYVEQIGREYRITITNYSDYASYVEFGHRTASHDGWVPGQFMLTISEQEVEKLAPALLEKRLIEYLKEAMS